MVHVTFSYILDTEKAALAGGWKASNCVIATGIAWARAGGPQALWVTGRTAAAAASAGASTPPSPGWLELGVDLARQMFLEPLNGW